MKRIMIMSGGLGNQMFQYALCISLRKKGFNVKLDLSLYDYHQMHNGFEIGRVFGIDEKCIIKNKLHVKYLKIFEKFKIKKIMVLDNFIFNDFVLNKPPKYIKGYWQDERYFKDVEDDVRNTFVFQNIDENNQRVASEIKDGEAVSLHIRRGDYAQFGMLMMGSDYYKQAVETIKKKVENPVFYIFSDDVKEASLIGDELGIRYQIISHNHGDDSYKDMYLMSLCKHNIIANSSFSWWGAWLNNNPEKIVIAPKVWTVRSNNHPQLDSWILL